MSQYHYERSDCNTCENSLYSLSKNTDVYKFDDQHGCLNHFMAVGKQRSSWDQMQYNKFVKHQPQSTKLVPPSALQSWKR